MMEVVLRVEFTLPNGELLTHDYGWVEASAKDHLLKKPPDWLENARKSWDHPQEPVVLRGDIKPGCEEEARAAIAKSAERPPPHPQGGPGEDDPPL